MKTKIDLRVLRVEDLPAADKLRQTAGWNQTLLDWRRLLALDPAGCFAAVDGEQVVGTATTTSFGTELAWIGMVLVDPSRRNQGIGRQLLNQCLEYLRGKGVRCIKLDATPTGQILYEKLGFQVEWPLARWMRTDAEMSDRALPVRPVASATNEDWNGMLELDRQVFGVDRAVLLQRLRETSIQSVICRAINGKLGGFGFLRDGVNADYIGPVASRTPEMGKSITLHLLRASHRPVYWDIPNPCLDAESWAAQLGLVRQRPLLRMFLGKNEAAGIPQQLWAISDPATG
jgi:GNAT superfamily N-acetyltransferase